uniref:Uncharacterized protein n=1 Tax=Panagrolaimus sp. JU765 TaxID=591449 RepID=A0AC34QZ94_9BILA
MHIVLHTSQCTHVSFAKKETLRNLSLKFNPNQPFNSFSTWTISWPFTSHNKTRFTLRNLSLKINPNQPFNSFSTWTISWPFTSHNKTRFMRSAMSRCQTTESYRNLGFRRASEGEQNISHRQHQEESSILIFRRGMAMTKNLLRVLVLGND